MSRARTAPTCEMLMHDAKLRESTCGKPATHRSHWGKLQCAEHAACLDRVYGHQGYKCTPLSSQPSALSLSAS